MFATSLSNLVGRGRNTVPADDILDVVSDTETLGKPAGSDEEQDKMRRTEHNKIFVAPPRNIKLDEFYQQLQELFCAAEHNDEGVVEQLQKMIPTFTPVREQLKHKS